MEYADTDVMIVELLNKKDEFVFQPMKGGADDDEDAKENGFKDPINDLVIE